MWPLGHLAGAYLCYTLVVGRIDGSTPRAWPVLALAVGSQFPDLLDKPLAWYLGVLPAGRSFAHSLLVVGPVCLAAIFLARRARREWVGAAFAVGVTSHLTLDVLPALWGNADPNILLWPVTPVEGYDGAPSILAMLADVSGQPYFLVEFPLALVALALWVRHGTPGLRLVLSPLRRLRGDRGPAESRG